MSLEKVGGPRRGGLGRLSAFCFLVAVEDDRDPAFFMAEREKAGSVGPGSLLWLKQQGCVTGAHAVASAAATTNKQAVWKEVRKLTLGGRNRKVGCVGFCCALLCFCFACLLNGTHTGRFSWSQANVLIYLRLLFSTRVKSTVRGMRNGVGGKRTPG